MIKSVIRLLTKITFKLQEFEKSYQSKWQKYSSPQCQKIAIVCASVGLVLGFAVGKNI